MSEFSGKKILILGPTNETIGLIEKAKELGACTIVAGNRPELKGNQYADLSFNVDVMDLEAMVSLVERERIDGVMVGSVESLLIPYARLCKKLNFPCLSTESIYSRLINKYEFKQLCRQFDVPIVPEYSFLDDGTPKDIKYPVVVKPVDSGGSQGITVCRDERALRRGIEIALSYSKQKKILIEKYMTCGEVVVYYTFQDGEPILTAMCDRYTNKEQDGVAQLPTAYIYPSRFEETYRKNVDEKVKRMFRAMGVSNGVMFIQSFVDERGNVYFYEPGYRLNGAQEHYIVSEILGFDAKEALVRFALTGKMAKESIAAKCRPFDRVGCKFSPLVKECTLGSMNTKDELMRLPGVIAVRPSYEPGDVVAGRGTLRQILTRVYVVEDNYEKLFDSLATIYSTMKATDESGGSVFLNFTDIGMLRSIYK